MKISDLNYYPAFIFYDENGFSFSDNDINTINKIKVNGKKIKELKKGDIIKFHTNFEKFKVKEIKIGHLIDDTDDYKLGFKIEKYDFDVDKIKPIFDIYISIEQI